jgi:hypothetical protein
MIPALRGLHLRTGAKGLIDRQEARKNLAGCWFDDSHFPSVQFFFPLHVTEGFHLFYLVKKEEGWWSSGSAADEGSWRRPL